MQQSDLVSSLALLLSVGRSLVPKGSRVVGQSLEAGRSWRRGKEGPRVCYLTFLCESPDF